MTLSPLFIFGIGFIPSFLSGLPLGPINVWVIQTTLKKNLRSGLSGSMGASLIEMCAAFLALNSTILLARILEDNPWFSIAAFAIFVAIGFFFIFTPNKPNTNDPENNSKFAGGGAFIRGAGMALLNPLILPFWVITLSYLHSDQQIQLSSGLQMSLIAFFLVGVYFGKFAALSIYGMVSKRVAKRLGNLKDNINKIVGLNI